LAVLALAAGEARLRLDFPYDELAWSATPGQAEIAPGSAPAVGIA